MHKKAILPVSCANDFASGAAETFYIEITPTLHQRIENLALVARENNLLAVEEFCYEGTWSSAFFDESEIVADLGHVIDNLTKSPCDVEIPVLRVTADAFGFTAVPKRAGDDSALSTAMISIEKLNTNDCVIYPRNRS
jgi:hypothetical protein